MLKNKKPWQIKSDRLEEKIILSTVEAIYFNEHGKYETAITFDKQKTWKVLKGYDTKEDAIKGHYQFKNMSIEELRKMEGL